MNIKVLFAVLAIVAVAAPGMAQWDANFDDRYCGDAAESVEGAVVRTYNDADGVCSCKMASKLLESDTPLELIVDGSGKATTTGVTRFDANNVYIVYKEADKYYNSTAFFNGATDSEVCNSQFTWTLAHEGCYRVWTGVAAWSDVYDGADGTDGKCGIKREEDSENNLITFSVDLEIHNTELLEDFRDVTEDRELQHKLPFQITFSTSVEATSSEVDIFAPVLFITTVTSSEVTGNVLPGEENPILTVEFTTSVQYPFVLPDVGGITTTKDGGATGDEFTFTRVSTCADTTDPELLTGPTCEQTWRFTVQPQSPMEPCSTTAYNGNFGFDTNLGCQASRTADCPFKEDSESATTITVGIATNNFCPVVIDELEINTEFDAYESYSGGVWTDRKDDFIDDQIMYFKLGLMSPYVSIQSTSLEKLTLQKTDGAGVTVGAAHDLYANNARTTGTGSVHDNIVMSVVNGPAAAENNYSYMLIQMTMDYEAFGIPDDAIHFFTLTAVVNVFYDFATSAVQKRFTLFADVGKNEYGASTTFGASGRSFAGATSAASSTAMMSDGAFIGVTGACVAGVVVVAALLVKRANARATNAKRSMERSASRVELTGNDAVSADRDLESASISDLSSVQQVKTAYDAIE
jgi:hypothetical protein